MLGPADIASWSKGIQEGGGWFLFVAACAALAVFMRIARGDRRTYEQQMAELRDKHERIVSELRDRHEKVVSELNADVRSVFDRHLEDVARLAPIMEDTLKLMDYQAKRHSLGDRKRSGGHS